MTTLKSLKSMKQNINQQDYNNSVHGDKYSISTWKKLHLELSKKFEMRPDLMVHHGCVD